MTSLDFSQMQAGRKTAKKGFEFTIIVVGESGLGKSTFVDTLLNVNMRPDREILSAKDRICRATEITASTIEIEERLVKMRLTVIDTPGFGDSIDNSDCVRPISNYIDQQFESYFHDESGLNRRNIVDSRIHACLYFIAPTGRGLRQIDIEFLKAVHDKVNIIPIIAKADAFTNSELVKMKSLVIKNLYDNGIRVYEFPECDADDDPAFIRANEEFKKLAPFAVIGAFPGTSLGGQMKKGRSYEWGFVDVENEMHCDFVSLKNMLLRTHTQDLKDITEEVHYENFRAIKLTGSSQRSAVVSKASCEQNTLQNSGGVDRDRLLAIKEAEIERMKQELKSLKTVMDT